MAALGVTPPGAAAPGAAAPTPKSVRGLLEDGRHAEAERGARELLAEVEAARGPDAVETAEALDLLVEALWRGGKTADPEPRALAERAVEIKEKVLGSGHLEVAASLSGLANVLRAAGDNAGARPLIERALAIRERALGPDHPDVGRILNNLANLLKDTGDYAAARQLYERALAIAETGGPDQVDVARALTNLGNLFYHIGDYARAEPLLVRAVVVAEKALGPDHPRVALCLLRAGNLRRDTGDYAGAHSLYDRALAIQEKSLGPDHPDVAVSLTNLGRLLREMGDDTGARPLYERALEIRERALGPEHPDVPKTLVSLAHLLKDTGDRAGARRLYERVLSIKGKVLPRDHPMIATDLTALANLLFETGDLAAARPLYERAIAISEKGLGPDNIYLSYGLEGLGDVLRRTGDRAGARQLYERSLAIVERTLGPDHPRVASNLDRLAELLAEDGQPRLAFDLALRAEEISRNHLRLTAHSLSERHALGYASVRVASLDLALELAPGARGQAISGARRRAWDALIRSRALVLEEMAARQRAVAEAGDPALAELAGELCRARERLAHVVVRGPGEEAPALYRRELDRAREEKEAAERALAERSTVFREEQARSQMGFEEVLAGLPSGSALVAFARIERSAASYLAFVLGPGDREPAAVELGLAEEIERLVARFRETAAPEAVMAERPSSEIEADCRRAGAALRQRVWDPVAIHLARAPRVFVVPDGALNLVDLAALPADPAGYLVETGPLIHYLSAERDLASPHMAVEGDGLLALGGPDFDAGPSQAGGAALPAASPIEGAPGRTGAGAGSPFDRPFRGALSSCGDFASMHFESLRGAAREAAEVADLWKQWERPRGDANRGDAKRVPDAVQLEGGAASEAAFKAAAPGKRVLHLATHGFFLGGRCPSAATPASESRARAISSQDALPRVAGENPLLLSGLALAGANRRAAVAAGEEDGILTAEEIAGLDLRGVESVVLSACDTGVGEVKAGEGVLGLRRAFAVAGARTVIMSLWPVDDRTARAWMRAFYAARWARGLETAEAVRAADLELLEARREKGLSTHPYYWAGFIAAGD